MLNLEKTAARKNMTPQMLAEFTQLSRENPGQGEYTLADGTVIQKVGEVAVNVKADGRPEITDQTGLKYG